MAHEIETRKRKGTGKGKRKGTAPGEVLVPDYISSV
jgi:hypothetical protein